MSGSTEDWKEVVSLIRLIRKETRVARQSMMKSFDAIDSKMDAIHQNYVDMTLELERRMAARKRTA
jgi:hypothetical protein